MKALVLLGSRNPEGQTAQAVNAMLEGMKESGVKSEIIILAELDIQRCKQCNLDGWGTCISEGSCSIKDDFQSVTEKIKKAELVIFATPVYFSNLSESMKAFTDRLRRTNFKKPNFDIIKNKKAIGICVAGGGGGGASACLKRLEETLNNIGFEILDLFPVRRQNLKIKLAVLKTAGKEYAIHL